MSALDASGWIALMVPRLLLENARKADMGRLGALGLVPLDRTFHGPLYMDFSISYRRLSTRAFSFHTSRSVSDKPFHASETCFAIVVVCNQERGSALVKEQHRQVG